jgi:hypothetical protein
MVTTKRDVLFIGVEAGAFDRYRESLSLAEFRADFISTVSGALELMVLLPYDALIVAYPTPDLPLERFLDAVRRENSSCRHAAVVLLAAPGWGKQAEGFIGMGANRVLAHDAPPELLQQILPDLLNAAPRIPMRLLTRLEVPSGLGPSRVLCQTVNVSSSGMLVRLDEPYPVGTEVGFELVVPGENQPIRGRAEVVRHTVQRRDPVGGVAVRFRSFRSGDRVRFTTTLTRHVVPDQLAAH